MPVLSFVNCIINSYLYIHFNNFFTPLSPLDGVNHLIRFVSEPSSFSLVCFAPRSNSFRFFSSRRLAFFEAPGAGSCLICFHGSQWDNVGIPSAKRKRGTTGIWTADLLGARQLWRPLDHDAHPSLRILLTNYNTFTNFFTDTLAYIFLCHDCIESP